MLLRAAAVGFFHQQILLFVHRKCRGPRAQSSGGAEPEVGKTLPGWWTVMWPTRTCCAWLVTSLLGNSFSRKSAINLDLFSFDAQLAKGDGLGEVGNESKMSTMKIAGWTCEPKKNRSLQGNNVPMGCIRM